MKTTPDNSKKDTQMKINIIWANNFDHCSFNGIILFLCTKLNNVTIKNKTRMFGTWEIL